ncbi:MAG: Maf family nucleotide pyrophosphatase [Bacteroidales bacterium]|jgi:septum formation protein|nr:Maf family nucleotide pyrophosphatase [Bacteroidales bacterium]MDD4385125.1 Maf family nucleotide pyrophosphatase [Bacteroidales bacterium]MDY0197715.1 Maf family nucleotide pyrophosphatase [Tenuifilaceae bacterium]
MLLKDALKDKILILASKSPRRQQLLAELGLPFEVRSNGEVDENFPANLPFEQIPEYLAIKKSEPYREFLGTNEILITSDTIVWINNKVLGKPADRLEAVEMLKQLSGNKHFVVTGVALVYGDKVHTFSAITEVFFRHLGMDEIEYYVDAFKPYDKAGAYGIQEWIGYAAVERIEGSYFNVMGLPVQKLYSELLAFLKE